MSNNHRPTEQKDQVAGTSLSMVGVHLLWMLLGPFVLGMLLFRIVQAGSGWFTGLDFGFLIVVLLMLCARWFEQRLGQGTTVYGESATWADLRRYVLTLPVVAGIAWTVANVIGNHF